MQVQTQKQSKINKVDVPPALGGKPKPEYITYKIETVTLTDNQKDALDPLKGQLVCAGFKEFGGATHIFCESNENAVLQQAWSYIISKIPNAVFMGFNVVNFDFQWLIKKGLKYCPEKVHKAQYYSIPQADLKLLLSGGDKQAKESLKDYFDFFNFEWRMAVNLSIINIDASKCFRAKEFDKIGGRNLVNLRLTEKLAEVVLNLKRTVNEVKE